MRAETYEYQDESLRRSFHKGEAKAVITFLRTRGIELTQVDEEKIAACDDSEQLERMVTKAATVQSAAELFE